MGEEDEDVVEEETELLLASAPVGLAPASAPDPPYPTSSFPYGGGGDLVQVDVGELVTLALLGFGDDVGS